MKASDIPSECLLNPQFVQVLTASLCSQIAESKAILADTDEEIQKFKDKVEQGLEKRKVLKQIHKDLKQKRDMQDAMLESLERDRKNRAIELDTVKNGLDDASLRQKADRAEYEKILNDYAVMWEQYKTVYEEFPLAKVREDNRTTVRKMKVQLMILEYKSDELGKMLEQRKSIDSMRVRAAGVDIAEMVLLRWKDQKYLDYLQNIGKDLRTQVKNLDRELLQLQEEDERHKLAEIETSKMPPPRLDFSFIRSACAAEGNFRTRRRKAPRSPGRDSDTASVNTLILEELCREVANEKTEIDGEKSIPSPKGKAADISIPASTIKVPGPTEPFLAQSNENQPEPMSVDETNIQNKLQKLGIQTPAATYGEQTECSNNNADEEAHDDYGAGSEESFLRTRRWCEESRKEFAPFLLEERRAKSVSERTPAESNDDEFKSSRNKIPKALSSHGSEMKVTSLRSEATSSKWSLDNEKPIAEQFDNPARRMSDWNEKMTQKSPSQVQHLGKRRREDPRTVETPARNNELCDEQGTSSENAHQAAEVSRRNDENSKVPTDKGENRPKVKAIEKSNFPWRKHMEQNTPANVPDYASSYMSSDNFSTINETAFLPQTPRAMLGSFITECEDTPGYPLFSTGQHGSPDGRQSVASFISTIADDQSNIQGHCPPAQEKTPVPAMNFEGFFGAKKKDQGSMF